MPMFQLAVCAIWRQHEGSSKKPTQALSISAKPANYLHLQYDLLPSAFYKTCSISLVNWGRVAKLVTADGSSSALAPIVHGSNVSAMVAQLEHPINVNQDGMLDLLHHKVNVTITEAKDAVPSAIRTKRPSRVEVVGREGKTISPEEVTLTTQITEHSTDEEAAEQDRALDLAAKDKDRRPSEMSVSSSGASEEPPAGLALPIAAVFSGVSDDLCGRQFSPLISSAEQLVTPLTEQVSATKNKGDKREHDVKAKSTGKKSSQKKPKPDDKRSQGDKNTDSGRGKKDKNEIVLTFNMDFFFSGTTQLAACSVPRPDAPGLVQVALLLRAPAFLTAQQRLALNPLVVHLRCLQGLPALPAGFSAASVGQRGRSEPAPTEPNEDEAADEEGGGAASGTDAATRPPTFFAAVHMPDGTVYSTPDLDYADQVTLNDLSVVFCGLLERELLWERFQTVPLRMELLWRHTTPLVSNKRFNQMEIDRYIHDPNLVNIIKQSGNPFALQNPLPTKFAEVLIDMSALTRGVRLLSLELPLTAVPAGPPAASAGADIERGTCPPPFRPLQLLQSAAQLSVTVSLAVPLDLLPRPPPARCAYGRLLAVLSPRGLLRSGVLQLIQQLNEPPSASSGGGAARRPGDVSTPGVSGFCLRDRQLHLLFVEGRADAELEQVGGALRGLSRRDAHLCRHSGLLFAERLYCARRPALFRMMEGRQLRALLLDTRLYTAQKRAEQSRAVRDVGECFRTQWLSDTLRQNLLPSETSLLGLQQLLAG